MLTKYLKSNFNLIQQNLIAFLEFVAREHPSQLVHAFLGIWIDGCE